MRPRLLIAYALALWGDHLQPARRTVLKPCGPRLWYQPSSDSFIHGGRRYRVYTRHGRLLATHERLRDCR